MPEDKQEIHEKPSTGNRGISLKPRPAGWLVDRFQSTDLFDFMPRWERIRAGLPPVKDPGGLIGKAMWISFLLIIISGIGLAAGYLPTKTGAFQSVLEIQSKMPFGWWFRGVHKYATDLFIILAVIRVIRIMYRRAYRAPAELTWIRSLACIGVVIVAGFTGYLLVWHSEALVTGTHAAGAGRHTMGGLSLLAWFGKDTWGEFGLSQSGLSFAYVLHIALGFLAMFVAFYWLTITRIKFPRHREYNPRIPRAIGWSVFVGLSFIALILPPPSGGAFDIALHPHPILADWYLLGFYNLASIIGWPVAIFFMAVFVLFMLLLPWIDCWKSPGPRPLITSLIVAGVLSIILFTGNYVLWTIPGGAILTFFLVVWFIAIVVGSLLELRYPDQKTLRSGEVSKR